MNSNTSEEDMSDATSVVTDQIIENDLSSSIKENKNDSLDYKISKANYNKTYLLNKEYLIDMLMNNENYQFIKKLGKIEI